jgi:Protein of unknown function (DUF3644)
MRRIYSFKLELINKSKEAALTAIKVFNDPLIKFKSESFIVLMIIAWTYLLHAFYRSKHVEYRYFEGGRVRRKFDRTKNGAYKYWELERCLNDKHCPIDRDAQNNLRFLIGLRHEIEHQMTISLDNYLSGRYQACVMNYNYYLKYLFGEHQGIDNNLTYSLQFLELTEEQILGVATEANVPERLRSYIIKFDQTLTQEEFENPKFSFKLIFVRQLVNRPGRADRVVEFVPPNSELEKEIRNVYKREVEKKKFLAKHVVDEVKKAGFKNFRTNPEHLQIWKAEDAKNPAKGYGVEIHGIWYWYEKWVKRVIELCDQAGGKYR